jgi:hypothetical protein
VIDASEPVGLPGQLQPSDGAAESKRDGFDSAFVASVELHDSQPESRTACVKPTNAVGDWTKLLESLGVHNSCEFEISNVLTESTCAVITVLFGSSLSFNASMILTVTFAIAASREMDESRHLNPSECLRQTVVLVSGVFELSNLCDPSELLRNREGGRGGAESGNDILCLRVAVVMFAVKHHRRESSTDGHEMGYETDLRDDLRKTADLHSDLDFDHEEEGEEEDMIWTLGVRRLWRVRIPGQNTGVICSKPRNGLHVVLK